MKRKKGMDSLVGLMDVGTKASGREANKMEEVYTATNKEFSEKEYGQMVRK